MMTIGHVARDDDVVGLRTLKLVESQFRFAPMNAVFTLGVAETRPAGGGLARGDLQPPCPVIHAVAIAVFKNTVIRGGVSFPESIVLDHDLLGR